MWVNHGCNTSGLAYPTKANFKTWLQQGSIMEPIIRIMDRIAGEKKDGTAKCKGKFVLRRKAGYFIVVYV